MREKPGNGASARRKAEFARAIAISCRFGRYAYGFCPQDMVRWHSSAGKAEEKEQPTIRPRKNSSAGHFYTVSSSGEDRAEKSE